MDRALWLLIGLQLRGWFRSLARGLRSMKGILLALVGSVVFIPWLTMMVFRRQDSMHGQQVLTYGPSLLLAYCVINVLLSSGDRAVYFSRPEITFLFSGPFTRRQLLGYKVAFTLLFALPSTLFLTIVMRAQSGWVLAAFVGVALMTTFMQLFGMALSLGAATLGARLFSRARRLMMIALLVAGIMLLRLTGNRGIDGLIHAELWHNLLVPLNWFFEASVAADWLTLLKYGSLGLLVNGVLLLIVFSLDSDYLEASMAYSARVYTQLQRLRGGPTYAGDTDLPSTPVKRRRGLPMPPILGGLGPLVWRQLTTALRSPGRLGGLLAMLLFLIAMILSVSHEAGFVSLLRNNGIEQPTMIGIGIVGVTFFLSKLLPLDFRGDLDRLEALKTLPLPYWRIALGQILAPVLVLCVFQWVILAGLALLEVYWGKPGERLSINLTLLLVGATAAFPYNFLLFAVENLLFLLFPSRLLVSTPGDFQAMGRNVLLMIVKVVTLSIVFGALAITAVVVWIFHSPLLVLIACWLVLMCFGAVMVPAAGLAFRWLDVTRDQPP